MAVHGEEFEGPARDRVQHGVELQAHFEEVDGLEETVRGWTRGRSHARLTLLVESLGERDKLWEGEIVVDVAAAHQSLEQFEAAELSQATAFQLQDELDTLKGTTASYIPALNIV